MKSNYQSRKAFNDWRRGYSQGSKGGIPDYIKQRQTEGKASK